MLQMKSDTHGCLGNICGGNVTVQVSRSCILHYPISKQVMAQALSKVEMSLYLRLPGKGTPGVPC